MMKKVFAEPAVTPDTDVPARLSGKPWDTGCCQRGKCLDIHGISGRIQGGRQIVKMRLDAADVGAKKRRYDTDARLMHDVET